MMTRGFTAKASDSGDDVELQMFGYIGEDWYGDGSTIDAKAVAKFLTANKKAKTINLQINSSGGSVSHGMAIYSSLKNHGAKIVANIQGLCASAMSTVVCSADEVVMNDGALFMIHEASGGMWGTAAELQVEADVLKKINSEMARLYAARSGQSVDEIVKMMAAETWMTAAEAKDKGFVTTISAHKTMSAECRPDQFANVPDRIKPMLELLVSPRGGLKESEVQMTVENKTASTGGSNSGNAGVTGNASATATTGTTQSTATNNAGAATNVSAPSPSDVAKAERERCSQITAACVMAGKGDLAAKYIDDQNATVASVQSALLTMVCQERAPLANAPGGAGETKPANPNAKYEKEYDDNQSLYESMSLTKEAYVNSRRVDDGLPRLAAVAK